MLEKKQSRILFSVEHDLNNFSVQRFNEFNILKEKKVLYTVSKFDELMCFIQQIVNCSLSTHDEW